MTPREGQRVRVILEGEARRFRAGDVFTVGYGAQFPNEVDPTAEHVVSVEVLPDPEPTEWGAARITSDGRLWLHRPQHYSGRFWLHIQADGVAVRAAWADLDDPRPAVRAEP